MKENWSFEIYLKIEVSKIIWKLGFWKLNLRIEILEIKFERNLNFENYLRIRTMKIKLWKLEFWKLEIKFRNRNFKELFKDESFKNK